MAPRYLLTSKEAEKITTAATITRKMTPTMIPNLRMVSYPIFGCDRSERVGYLKYELCSATNSKLQTGRERNVVRSARRGNVQSPYALMLPKDRSQSWRRFVSCRARFTCIPCHREAQAEAMAGATLRLSITARAPCRHLSRRGRYWRRPRITDFGQQWTLYPLLG